MKQIKITQGKFHQNKVLLQSFYIKIDQFFNLFIETSYRQRGDEQDLKLFDQIFICFSSKLTYFLIGFMKKSHIVKLLNWVEIVFHSKFSRERKRILARKCPKYRIYDNRSAVELNLQSIDDNLNIWYDFPINQAKTDYCQACNLKSITR